MIFETSISFTDDGGKTRKADFLIDDYGTMFAENEIHVMETFTGYADLEVLTLKRSRIKEIANDKISDDDKIWMAELQDIYFGDNGEEKYMTYKIAFFAPTFERAQAFIAQYVKQGYNMALVGMKQTKFADVI